jgi:ABC-type transport system involved in cytochrome c biogenesis permease subunit
MNNVLFHIILLAYLVASLMFWLSLGLQQRWLVRAANGLLVGGFGVQTGLLGYRLWTSTLLWWGHVPSYMELLAWAIVLMYFIALWRYRIDMLGAFIVPLAFLATAASGVPVAVAAPLPLALRHVWLGLHIFLALMGYAALALAFGAGVMYLIQERQLKLKRPGTWYQRLPSLTLLDEMNARTLILGFPLLTQGIVTGSLWAKYSHGSYLQWNLTSLPLLLAWTLYAMLLGGRRALGWQGKKAAYAAVGGFVVVLVSYFVHTL